MQGEPPNIPLAAIVPRVDTCGWPGARPSPTRWWSARRLLLALLAASGSLLGRAEEWDGRDGRPLALENFRPESMLVVPQHLPAHARFPVVDVHVHPRIRLHHDPQQLDDFVRLMDQHRLAVAVSLDGGLGDQLDEHLAYLWTRYSDRFVVFMNLDWRGSGRADQWATWACNQPDFAHRMAEGLRAGKQRGASGLKIFKEFGLVYRQADGHLIQVDDPRFDPIWSTCGELGLPVLMHVADPLAFFRPVDATNERWEELRRHPDWTFSGADFPSHAALLAAFRRLIARHPQTTFIGAHVASSAEDLQTVGACLEAHPNLYVDLAARIAELGRQPATAKRFLTQYSSRVLFGTDGPRTHDRLLPHWRFLETGDEYFPYAENPFPPQGFWRIYGVDLADDVLRAIYSENAARLIPGVAERLSRVGPALAP